MKKDHLIQQILACNLRAEEKQALIEALNSNTKNHTKFILELLKILGISKKVFDAFHIDIGELLKKLFEK